MLNKSLYILMICCLISGCSKNDEADQEIAETQSSANLDEAAIAAGILPDPKNIKLEGRFETRNDIGTDKFCAIKKDNNQYNVGILAVFGSDSKCEARGEARIDGTKIIISLNETPNSKKNSDEICEFTANYDGISLQLPGDIPEICAKFCNNRASLSGTGYFLTDEGNAAARKSRGRDLNPLCRG